METPKKYGHNIHRLKENDPYYALEVAFAETFNDEIKFSPNMIAQLVGNPARKGWLTEEEEMAVLSTIQWLGTPVGQGFLEKVSKKIKTK